MQVHTQERVHLLVFEHLPGSDGRPLSVPIPIPRGKAGELFAQVEHAGVRAGELDEAYGIAKRVPELSDVGRRARVAEHVANTRRAADTAMVDANHQLSVVADKRAALFEPPMPTDAIGATQEASVQARYATMPKDERKKLHVQMAARQNDTALFALLRDPLAMGPDAEIIRRTIWEPRVAKERAADLAQLDDAEEEAKAARAGAGGILHALEKFAAK